MTKKKEDNKTITMTEAQLKEIIRSSIKTALRELKAEEKLPGNEVDELKEAPATYSLLFIISGGFLFLFFLISVSAFGKCVEIALKKGLNISIFLAGFIFIAIGGFSIISIIEICKTKKTEVLNTVFSAVMALSSLLLAFMCAAFAYMALK